MFNATTNARFPARFPLVPLTAAGAAPTPQFS